jgi:isoleucyl-tRNA synthetase
MELKETVNLPKTAFPMRAALAEREPIQVRAWLESKVYEKLVAQNEGHERFILHDGPPYANGTLHLGHFLNKVLKDMVVKAQLMLGRLSEYVPGWDCHGLPIEQQVDKQLGPKKREMSASDFRRACRKFAEEQVVLQRDGFQRLGVFGLWDKPYLTMSYDYEAQTVRELASIAAKGALYRRKRPVHWCIRDVTALAEAEVEYHEKTSPSIYVGFRVVKGAPDDEPGSSPSGPRLPGPFRPTSRSRSILSWSTSRTRCPGAGASSSPRRWSTPFSRPASRTSSAPRKRAARI